MEELACRAVIDERNRLAWECVHGIAQIAMKKCATEMDRTALVEGLTLTFDSLKDIVPTNVAIAEELVEQDLRYILGPGENSSERNIARTAILHPEKHSKKEWWEIIAGYLRGPTRNRMPSGSARTSRICTKSLSIAPARRRNLAEYIPPITDVSPASR